MSTVVAPLTPFKGLAPFEDSDDDALLFFGRERETQELLDLLRVESIALLFGKSGLGKTSLLLAGVFPHLKDEGFLPVYVRINYDVEDTTPEEQVVAAIRRAARPRLLPRGPRDRTAPAAAASGRPPPRRPRRAAGEGPWPRPARVTRGP